MKIQSDKIIVLLSWVCALALSAMALVLTFDKKTTVQNFVPPLFESNALLGTPDVPDDLGWSELNTDVFSVGVCGKVTVSNYKANIWLTNPVNNSIWIKLRILDEYGNILGETGLLTPGQYVQTVSLNTIPAVGSSVILKVMTYEPETYHSAGSISLNTSIY